MTNVKSNVVALPKKDASDRQIHEALVSSGRKAEKHQEEVRKAYDKYLSYGWKPVAIHPGKKRPIGNNWLEKSAPERGEFEDWTNIGVVNGEKSGGNTDLDIDDRELVDVVGWFMPQTGAKFGRYYGEDKQVLAHWLYRSNSDKSYVIKKPYGGVALELRSNGGQTVFPPSFVYDNDLRGMDLVCWDGGAKAEIPALEAVTEVPFDLLKRRANLLAASYYCSKEFKPGSYHIDLLAWCGLLAKAGYDRAEAKLSVEWIVMKSGYVENPNLDNHLAGLDDTYEKYEQGEIVSGISVFRDAGWDEKIVGWLKGLLKVKSDVESDGRPQVRVVASKETELLDDTLKAMVDTKKFYSLSGQVVVINRENNFDGSVSARMTPLADTVAMGSWLTREIQFIQSVLDKAAMTYKDQLIKAPTTVSSELANPHTFRGELPQIVGISNIPLITRTGRVIDDHWNYDRELKVFFACRHPVQKTHPDEALRVLREIFIDFPFTLGGVVEDNGARLGERYGRYFAAAISAVLSAVVRPAMDICPMYAITSSQWSDGKSVMCNSIAASVGMESGTSNSPLTRGGSDEEQEKQLSSVLAKGKRVITLDNHDGELRSPALTEVLTSAMPEFRVLGKNEVRTVPNRSLMLINGVNMVLAGDLQTRTVMVRLARTDLAGRRKFKHLDLPGWVLDNNDKIVSAAITLIDWALHQDDGDWVPSHRFKVWDHLVRRTILLACGVDISPPANEDEDRELDPVEEVKHEFLEWVANRWESGLRDSKYKHYLRGNTLAQEIAPDSQQEGWVNVISRRKFDPLDKRVGYALSAVKDYPFQTKDGVFRVRTKMVDKRSMYWVEAVK